MYFEGVVIFHTLLFAAWMRELKHIFLLSLANKACLYCLALIASHRLCLVPASMQGKWTYLVSQVRWKERKKGEEGALNFYNFLLSPKSPNEWHNIPLWIAALSNNSVSLGQFSKQLVVLRRKRRLFENQMERNVTWPSKTTLKESSSNGLTKLKR